MTETPEPTVQELLAKRFPDAPINLPLDVDASVLRSMAGRGSCRLFLERQVPDDVVSLLCAVAFASPTKSDLQQRDIILLKSARVRTSLANLVGGQMWVADAPMIAVFCGNNRRQRQLHAWRDIPFANDHFDAPFNAATDAAIALGAFVTAAEALGLGCCPLSAVRNEASAVSDLMGLPNHVFPFAGLAFGYPAQPPKIAMRLPLNVTCHVDRFDETGVQEAVADYDRSRATAQPYAAPRMTEAFGTPDSYGWSDEKARQYSQPERKEFGAFMRSKGFSFE